MRIAARIKEKLGTALAPERLEITDQSHLHAGHAHHGGVDGQPGGETHFRVEIVSAAFEGQPRLARQRRVYEILKEELAEGVHALSLATLTPDEAKRGT